MIPTVHPTTSAPRRSRPSPPLRPSPLYRGLADGAGLALVICLASLAAVGLAALLGWL